MVIGDETWHYLLLFVFFFPTGRTLRLGLRTTKVLLRSPSATARALCGNTGNGGRGDLIDPVGKEKEWPFFLLPLLITIFSMFVFYSFFLFFSFPMWLGRRKIHPVATPFAFHSTVDWE